MTTCPCQRARAVHAVCPLRGPPSAIRRNPATGVDPMQVVTTRLNTMEEGDVKPDVKNEPITIILKDVSSCNTTCSMTRVSSIAGRRGANAQFGREYTRLRLLVCCACGHPPRSLRWLCFYFFCAVQRRNIDVQSEGAFSSTCVLFCIAVC